MKITAISRIGHLLTILIGIAILLASCTVYYKTSDIKKTFSQSQKEMNKSLGKIAKDLDEKKSIYHQLVSNIPDSSMTPYPALSMELITMTRNFSMLKQTASELEHMKADFSRLIKGKKKIESKSSLWKDFQVIKNAYEAQSGSFEMLGNDYNTASNQFITTMNEYKIPNIKLTEVRQQMQAYLDELSTSVQQVSSDVQKYKQSSNISQKRLDPLEEILKSIESDQKTMETLLEDFEKEFGQKEMIWSGPGSLWHSINADMQQLGDSILEKGQKFNKLAKDL